MSVSSLTLECLSVPQIWNVSQSCKTGMSISPANLKSPTTLECSSVPRLWNVVSPAALECCQSRNSGMLSILQLWHVLRFHNSGKSVSHPTGMSISPATLECPSVPWLLNVYQSHNSGMSISTVTLDCLSVQQLWNDHRSFNS